MSRKTLSRWLLLLIIPLLAAGAYVYARRPQAQGSGARWRTTTVTRGDLRVSIASSGSIRPSSEVEVKSRATGVVRAVEVNEGDRVVRGQVLARIDDPDAQAAVRNARADVDSAVARLRQVEAQRVSQRAQESAQVGQAQASLRAAQARLAEVLAGARREEIAQAEQAVRSAQADFELARRNYERTQQLFREGFVPRQQVDQAEAQLRSAEAAHRSAGERVRLLRAGATPEAVAQARAAVHQAEAALQQARARALEDPVRAQEIAAARAQVAQARSQLANAQTRLGETLIRAPVTGLVSRRSVEVGQSVIGSLGSGGTSVLILAVDSPLLAKVMVDEVDIARVRPGLPAHLTADALPGETFSGSARAVSPNAQVQNNVVQYEVTVVVDDPQRRLRLGMTVDAEFIISNREDVLLVPREAVRGEESKAVMVVEGETLVPRIVQVGGTDGRMVEIRSGVREGEVIFLGEARTEERPSPPGQNPFAPRFRTGPGRR